MRSEKEGHAGKGTEDGRSENGKKRLNELCRDMKVLKQDIKMTERKKQGD